MLEHPLNGFIAGLVVAVLIITGMNFAGIDIGSSSAQRVAPVQTSQKSAEDFVERWSQMRMGKWSVDSTFTRHLDSGTEATVEIHEAQNPPNSLNENANSTEIKVNGERYLCGKVSKAASSCRLVGKYIFDQDVKDEVVAIRSLVIGENRIYDVSKSGGNCFELYKRPLPAKLSLKWGNKVAFCFDEKTSALKKTQIWKDGGMDLLIATKIRSEVKTEEIKVPQVS